MLRAGISRSFVASMGLGIAMVWIFAAVCALVSAAGSENKEDPNTPALPDVPKLSSFAPAKDLADQVRDYIKEIETTLADEQEYKDSEGKIGRCANTMAVMALCLGMHDEDNQYKARAPAID